jgi:23S rRNA pseudouridine1911/1915/1917 synthase
LAPPEVFTVSSDESETRLDVFLLHRLSVSSRATVQKWIRQKNVLINGKSAKSSHKLHPGDRIELNRPAESAASATLAPWDFPLDVVYEDESILAINKPSGMVTHPGAGNRSHTLANAVLSMHPELSAVGHPLRPGIVHRLDKETSGLVLLARTQEAYAHLVRLFKDRAIEKHYRAFAYGEFPHTEGRIEKALGRDPRDRKKISIRARQSRSAVTLYRVLQKSGYASLLDVQILTGRTHQIRVHLSSEHHPIVGDGKYGGGDWNRIPDPKLREMLRNAAFFGLHSYSLKFAHPADARPMLLQAPLPKLWNELGR